MRTTVAPANHGGKNIHRWAASERPSAFMPSQKSKCTKQKSNKTAFLIKSNNFYCCFCLLLFLKTAKNKKSKSKKPLFALKQQFQIAICFFTISASNTLILHQIDLILKFLIIF
jgi:hypothetical protein